MSEAAKFAATWTAPADDENQDAIVASILAAVDSTAIVTAHELCRTEWFEVRFADDSRATVMEDQNGDLLAWERNQNEKIIGFRNINGVGMSLDVEPITRENACTCREQVARFPFSGRRPDWREA